MVSYSYTLTGQSKYIQRHTSTQAPIIKRPIHVLADGTAVAIIVDENDSTAKYGNKNNVVQIKLYQSDLNRTTWTLRATYTLPAGKYPTGTSTMHTGSCLMVNESIYFVWRGDTTTSPVGYQVYGAVFTKTSSTAWSAPSSYETLFQPSTRFPFRFDLDVNKVTGDVFVGWMYRDDTSTSLRTGVRICHRKSSSDFTVLNVYEGIGTTGNVAHMQYAEDFTLAVDPASNATTTRINYLTSGSMATKDYGDSIGYVVVRNSDETIQGKGFIKTGFNSGKGGGRRTSYMFSTANGEFAIIGVCGTTSAQGFVTKYKTTDPLTNTTPSYSNLVPPRYTSGTHAMNRTNSVWSDCSVTYANGNFAVHFHDSYFRDMVGKFTTMTVAGSPSGMPTATWESPNYTWDSFVGTGIVITDTWRKAPASAVYGGSRNTNASNKHDTLLVYFSRSNLTGFDTAWAAQHNRPWKAPNAVSPAAASTVNTSVPILSAYADLDQPAPRSYTYLKWQVASNSSFTTNLKEIETTAGVAVNDTHLSGSQVYMAQRLTQALALTTGTWYVRAAQRDSFGTYGTYSATQQFSVAHPPWGTDLTPSGGIISEYGTGTMGFIWTFNDAYDQDTQTAYRVLVQLNDEAGTVVLDSGKVVSTDNFADLVIPATAKNQELKWSVQLWDIDDNPGGLSDFALFTVADPPTVTINTPADLSTVDNARPQVEWVTDDPLGTGQAAFRVFFLNEGVMIHDSGWRNGGDQAYQPDDIILQNEKSYSMTVQVRDNAGLASQSQVNFVTEWVVPVSPNLSSLFVDTSSYDSLGRGYVRIVWENQTADPEFLSWRLYRRYHLNSGASVDDKGWEWELVYEEFSVSPPDDSEQYEFLDYTAPSGYEVHYTLTQAAVRFGSVVESSKPTVDDIGRQVSLYSEHYWLIMPDASGLVEDALRLENATADNYTEEYETEEIHLIGRGRHFDMGDRLGYSGQLTLQLRYIQGVNSLDDPRRQKLDLENFRAKRSECWIRSPYGDLFMAFTGDMQFDRIAGVGRSEFTNVTLPYKEVYRADESNN